MRAIINYFVDWRHRYKIEYARRRAETAARDAQKRKTREEDSGDSLEEAAMFSYINEQANNERQRDKRLF